MFFPYYLVLFPRTLSPKLPVLTSALANSSTSKQKTDVEQGIIIMKCYCLFETLLAYMSSKLPLSQVICCDCRNCRNCLKSNYVRHKCFNFCPYYDQLLSSTLFMILTFQWTSVICLIGDLSNTKDCVWPHFQKRVENATRNGLFLTNFEVFGNVIKHGLECLIYLLNRNQN